MEHNLKNCWHAVARFIDPTSRPGSIFFVFTSLSLVNCFSQTNFWQQTHGPEQADVYALVANHQGDVFLGTRDAGVFRSTNNGDRWASINDGLSNISVKVLAVSPQGYVFAGTEGGGVFRSFDNGDHWAASNFGLLNYTVLSIAFDSQGGIFLVTGGFGGIYRSTDQGLTWIRVDSGVADVPIASVAVGLRDHVILGTAGSGLYDSRDYGNNWTQNITYLSSGGTDVIAIDSMGHIFFANHIGSIFRSKTDGNGWEEVYTSLEVVQSITVTADGAILAGDVVRSTDDGDHWLQVKDGIDNTSIRCLASMTNGFVFAGASYGGVFRSTNNGDLWNAANAGLTNSYVGRFILDDCQQLIAGVMGGISLSTDKGVSWQYSSISNAWMFAVASDLCDTLFAARGSVVFRSTDHGGAWSALNTVMPNILVNYLLTKPGGTVLAATAAGIYLSTNHGDTWASTGMSIDTRWFASAPGGWIFAATGSGIYKSIDGRIWSNVGLSTKSVNCIFIKPGGELFAGADGVYQSTNNGMSWNNIGLVNQRIQSLAVNSAGDLFAAIYYGGVYWSTDGGGSWRNLSSGLPGYLTVTSLVSDSSNNLFVGTMGEGVFRGITPTTERPLKPELSFPPNNATHQRKSLTLSWYDVPLTSFYHLQLSPDSTFTGNFLIDDSSLIDHSRPLENLGNHVTYYWRVRATNDFGTSDWSAVWNFTTFDSMFFYSISPRWNLVSIPIHLADYSTTGVFPSAISSAFAYESSYVRKDTLKNNVGYWLKFASATSIGVTGDDILSTGLDLQEGWNLIGSITYPLPVSSVTFYPPELVSSNFFGYENGYTDVDTLKPGQGYWIKTSQTGSLTLNAPGAVAGKRVQEPDRTGMNSLTIRDHDGYHQELFFGDGQASSSRGDELPPVPPGTVFDVRFASGRMLERADRNARTVLPILVSGASSPLEISWSIQTSRPVILNIGGRAISLTGKGAVSLAGQISSVVLHIGNISDAPTDYSLVQNYPNPFNPTTLIRYVLPIGGHVRLRIFDLLGREMKTVIDRDQNSGEHTVEFDGSSLPSGVYIYRLQSGRFVDTKKMLLIR